MSKRWREFWLTPHIVGDKTGGKQRWAFEGWFECEGEPIHVVETKALTEAQESIADAYKSGYTEAVKDFGIWKDGVQRIGCLETPIKEVLERKFGAK